MTSSSSTLAADGNDIGGGTYGVMSNNSGRVTPRVTRPNGKRCNFAALPMELRMIVFEMVIADTLSRCWQPRKQSNDSTITYTFHEPALMQVSLWIRREVEICLQAALEPYITRLASKHGPMPQRTTSRRIVPERPREVLDTHHKLTALSTYLAFVYEISLESCQRLESKDDAFAAIDLAYSTHRSRVAYVAAALKAIV